MNAAATKTEIKVTPWSGCVDGPWYPGLDHGGYVAYRIWQEFNGRGWFQRHEWKRADGSIEMENWINGAKGWNTRAEPVSEAE